MVSEKVPKSLRLKDAMAEEAAGLLKKLDEVHATQRRESETRGARAMLPIAAALKELEEKSTKPRWLVTFHYTEGSWCGVELGSATMDCWLTVRPGISGGYTLTEHRHGVWIEKAFFRTHEEVIEALVREIDTYIAYKTS